MRAKSLKINLLVYESHHHRRTLGKEGFEAITDYIITKPQLCGKLISLYVPLLFSLSAEMGLTENLTAVQRTACGLQVMGFPVCLEHNKFARNALWCALCLLHAYRSSRNRH